MKTIFQICLMLCLTGLSSCVSDSPKAGERQPVNVGDRVPAFTVYDGDGQEKFFESSDFSGKISLIVFFDTTCPDCAIVLPKVQEAWDELKDGGLGLLAIARDQPAETVRTYWRDNGFDMPWFTDPGRKAFSKFATITVPRLYLIDETSTVVWIAVEKLPDESITDIINEFQNL